MHKKNLIAHKPFHNHTDHDLILRPAMSPFHLKFRNLEHPVFLTVFPDLNRKIPGKPKKTGYPEKNSGNSKYIQPVIQGSGIQGLLVVIIWPKIRVDFVL